MIKKKLVRDKIHEIYEHRPMHIADDQEYSEELVKKLELEVGKLKKGIKAEDLIDIIELCHAMSEFKGLSARELEKMRKDKAKQRGRFKKRIIFDEFDPEQALNLGEE